MCVCLCVRRSYWSIPAAPPRCLLCSTSLALSPFLFFIFFINRHLPPLFSPSPSPSLSSQPFVLCLPRCHCSLILSSLLLLVSHFNIPPLPPPHSASSFPYSPLLLLLLLLLLLPSSLSSSLHLSSDLYKSLQSGSQAALPPHLQLAFSGNLHSSSTSSSLSPSICLCHVDLSSSAQLPCCLLCYFLLASVYLMYIWHASGLSSLVVAQ